MQCSQSIPFDTIGEISAQADDSYKIPMAMSSFPTYFMYCIAAYPVDNAIYPLNNWGLVGSYIRSMLQSRRQNKDGLALYLIIHQIRHHPAYPSYSV